LALQAAQATGIGTSGKLATITISVRTPVEMLRPVVEQRVNKSAIKTLDNPENERGF
jgi:hypothetical protein